MITQSDKVATYLYTINFRKRYTC